MTKSQTVDAEQAFGLFYELFKAKPWLIRTGVPVRMDANAEEEAVAFLLALVEGRADDWGNLKGAARATASGLLVDFVAKLRQPQSSFSRATWQVPASASAWQQALAIVGHEIRRAHPRQTDPH